MNDKELVQVVATFIEVFNTQNWTKLSELFTENASYHSPVFPAPLTDLAAIHHYFEEEAFVAFPDCQAETRRLFGQEPHVCWEYVLTGTHKGPLRGLSPTYKTIRAPGCWILTLEDGKITRIDSYLDNLAYRAQLGIA